MDNYQQFMDETMCRPGYQWMGKPINRCVAAGDGRPVKDPVNEITDPEVIANEENTAAPAKRVANGRGSVRVNVNGIVQKGTAMGQSITI